MIYEAILGPHDECGNLGVVFTKRQTFLSLSPFSFPASVNTKILFPLVISFSIDDIPGIPFSDRSRNNDRENEVRRLDETL